MFLEALVHEGGLRRFFLFEDGALTAVVEPPKHEWVEVAPSAFEAVPIPTREYRRSLLESSGIPPEQFDARVVEFATTVVGAPEPLFLLKIFPVERSSEQQYRRYLRLVEMYDGAGVRLGESRADVEDRLGLPLWTVTQDELHATSLYGTGQRRVGTHAVPHVLVHYRGNNVHRVESAYGPDVEAVRMRQRGIGVGYADWPEPADAAASDR